MLPSQSDAIVRISKLKECTTISSDLGLYGSLTRPFELSLFPLVKVSLELLTPLMKICAKRRSENKTE
jgi:hypothetical protein